MQQVVQKGGQTCGLGERVDYGVSSVEEKVSRGQHGSGQPVGERGFWLLPEKLFFRKFCHFLRAESLEFIFGHISGRLLFL